MLISPVEFLAKNCFELIKKNRYGSALPYFLALCMSIKNNKDNLKEVIKWCKINIENFNNTGLTVSSFQVIYDRAIRIPNLALMAPTDVWKQPYASFLSCGVDFSEKYLTNLISVLSKFKINIDTSSGSGDIWKPE